MHRIEDIGIQLSLITYMRLEEVFFVVRNNIGTYTGTSCPLSDFFSSFKKGSKSVRRYLREKDVKKINICNSTYVTTFFRLLGEPILDEQQLKKIKLSNKHREFLFKCLKKRNCVKYWESILANFVRVRN